MKREHATAPDAARVVVSPEPLTEGQLIAFLEPDQLVRDAAQPVARAVLTTRVQTALWALRAFTVLLASAVVYAFVAALVR